MIQKGVPWCKLSYKAFKEQNIYDTLIGLSPFPILSQLTDLLGGILHCATDVGNCTFDRNINFLLRITHDELDYCCTNYYNTEIMNAYKGVFNYIRVLPKEINKFYGHK